MSGSRFSMLVLVGWCFAADVGIQNSPAQKSVAARTPVTAIAVSPDGILVVGSQSGLQLYSVHSAEPELLPARMTTSLTEIQAIEFSPDGNRLVVAGGTPAEVGIVELFAWTLAPKREVRMLQRVECHSDVVTDVTWSQSGKHLATGSLDATWQLFDVTGDATTIDRLKPVRKIEGHSRGVTSIDFLSEEQIVTASLDSTIRLWDASSGKLVRTLSNHRAEIHSTSVRPADEEVARPMLASVGKDRTMRLWQPTIGRLVRFAQLDSEPLSVTWLSDGSRVIVGCLDGSVRFIDPDSVKTVKSYQTAGSRLWSVAVDSGSKQVFFGGASRRARSNPAFWQVDLR